MALGDVDGDGDLDAFVANYGEANEVWLNQPAPAPEIDVQGNGQSIPNGDTSPTTADDTDFGSALAAGGQVTHTFTISNSGYADLNLTGTPAVTLTTGTRFTVTVQPASPVISNSTTTFDVTFDPAATGSFTDTVNIANNDADENPYTFVVSGTGTVAALSADLAISKTLQLYGVSTITFTLTSRNLGPDAADGAVVSDTLPANVTNVTWTCSAAGGAACGAASGSGDVLDTLGAFPSGGVVTYTVDGTLTGWSHILNTAEVTPPAGVNDPAPDNNRATVERYQVFLPAIFKNWTP